MLLNTTYVNTTNTRPHHQFQTFKTKSLCYNITLLFAIYPHPFYPKPLVLQYYTPQTEPPCHTNRTNRHVTRTEINRPLMNRTAPIKISTNRNDRSLPDFYIYYIYIYLFILKIYIYLLLNLFYYLIYNI